MGSNPERSFDDLDESSLLTKDEPFCLGHREILARLSMRFQPRAIRFIRREAVERNQAPRHVVRPFMREEVPDEVPAAFGDDPPPKCGRTRRTRRAETGRSGSE